jgi:hypothetical protein
MIGGTGNDIFAFVDPTEGINVPTNDPFAGQAHVVTDFTPGEDQFAFFAPNFGGLTLGDELLSDIETGQGKTFFSEISNYAGDASGPPGEPTRFIFDPVNERLIYDADVTTPGYTVIADTPGRGRKRGGHQDQRLQRAGRVRRHSRSGSAGLIDGFTDSRHSLRTATRPSGRGGTLSRRLRPMVGRSGAREPVPSRPDERLSPRVQGLNRACERARTTPGRRRRRGPCAGADRDRRRHRRRAIRRLSAYRGL